MQHLFISSLARTDHNHAIFRVRVQCDCPKTPLTDRHLFLQLSVISSMLALALAYGGGGGGGELESSSDQIKLISSAGGYGGGGMGGGGGYSMGGGGG